MNTNNRLTQNIKSDKNIDRVALTRALKRSLISGEKVAIKVKNELISEVQVKIKDERPPTKTKDEYMTTFKKGNETLAQMGFGAEPSTYFAMVSKMGDRGLINASAKQIAEIVGLKQDTIRKAIKSLVEKQIFLVNNYEVGKQKIYKLNPAIGGRQHLRILEEERREAENQNQYGYWKKKRAAQ